MPAILTHKAITLMTRQRLEGLKTYLDRNVERRRIAGQLTDFDGKMKAMVDDAILYMNAAPLVDARTMEQRDGNAGLSETFLNGVSKFAVMGSMGPDLPAFAHFFQPGQGWAFDTIHKGNPDYNRDRVIARTTDMALALHRKGEARIAAEADAAKRTTERAKLRAYVMGHLCHVAADIVSHPFINDVEWHSGLEGHDGAGHAKNELMLDAAVSKQFFRRPAMKTGQGWADWWPTEDELGDVITSAYADAFKEVYGEDRLPGFADFEAHAATETLPEMTPEFMKHGYKTFRDFGVSFGYGWSYWDWFGMLSPLILPTMAAPLIAQALPNGRYFLNDPDDKETERTSYELLSLPMATGALSGLIAGGMLLPYSRKGDGEIAILGVVVNSYTLATWLTGLIEGAAVDDPKDGIPSGIRWGFFLAAPAFFQLPFMVELIRDAVLDFEHPRPFVDKPRLRQSLVNLINFLPTIAFVAMAVMLLIFLAAREINRAATGDDKALGLGSWGFWLTNLLWVGLLVFLWIQIPKWVQDARVPDQSDPDDDPLKKHAVRLFDDQTLFVDPDNAGPAADMYYPSDIRPLAKLWWDGAGDMTIRSDRYGLTFQHSGGGEAQTVPSPMIPMTVAEFLQLLEETVTDSGGTAGGLKGAVFDAETKADYPLPTGAAFASHGDFDRDPTEAKINTKSAEFQPLGDSEATTDYTLYHAPKPYQAVRMTPEGTILGADEAAIRAQGHDKGYSYVFDAVTGDAATSEALMAKAADLGALLCMGATQHISSAPVGGDRVYQVFRNWSLDRRRINEWKMLVEGDARSDKTNGADQHDPAMPVGDDGPADPAAWRSLMAGASDAGALTEAFETANGFGWIPVLREFARIVEAGEDLTDGTANPTRDGVPSPRAIGRAMAWLVDAPDPAEV